jgi:hypothetical protein
MEVQIVSKQGADFSAKVIATVCVVLRKKSLSEERLLTPIYP